MRILIFFHIISLITVSSGLAESSKFHIKGDTLFYDTTVVEEDDHISFSDADIFRTLLFQNPEVVRVNLHSHCGHTESGLEIGRIVSDFNIDTEVTKECSSACVLIFLAGQNRELKTGGLIGFHRPSWSADSLRKYYAKSQSSEGWSDPFAFALWVQTDVLRVAGQIFEYYSNAGVDISFAAETLKTPNDAMWYPNRDELTKVGIITYISSATVRPRMRPLQPKNSQQDIDVSLLN